ncbi:MAG TPA: pilus assembly protein TadG-related protein [Pyrinomonadaceae bacterium]
MNNSDSPNQRTEVELQPEPLAENPAFVQDERGQISILVVLSIIPFVLLLAFIFNSANQTSRKIQMQGAADATAVASAVTVARGMNFMVLNNNAMAEVLSLMVAIRCLRNTARIMAVYLTIRAAITCAAAAACNVFCANLIAECAELTAAAIRWGEESSRWSSIDSYVNNESGGFGWRVLGILDGLNQISKTAFAFWSAYQAREYARKNSANYDPIYGLVFGGKSNGLSIGEFSLPLPIPTFPVARGPEEAIAFRADDCQYKLSGKLNIAVSLYLMAFDPKRSVESVGIYLVLRWANLNHLEGEWGALGSVFNFILDALPGAITGLLGRITSVLGSFLGIEFLDWKSDPPKPMLLTNHPDRNETDERELDDDALQDLRPYLQYLGVALGRVPPGSPIGGELFLNKPNELVQVQFTYAQADVYNPKKWDMWTQDWRAQLSRSTVFDRKVDDLLQLFSLPSMELNWEFVNTH